MGFLNIFPKKYVNETILDLYLDIEIHIAEIETQLTDYLSYVYAYFQKDKHNSSKEYYSIYRTNEFFKSIKQDYAFCYTIRKNYNHYNFNKNASARAKKIEIETILQQILTILKNIHTHIAKLDKTQIKSNDMSQLLAILEDYVREVKLKQYKFIKIKKEDEKKVIDLVNMVEIDAKSNMQNNIWLIDQKNNTNKLHFSCNHSLQDLKYLELIPFLELSNINKRSLLTNDLHKDKVLPVYHYNLIVNGKNIHIIPRTYKNKITQYLTAA